MLTGVLTEQNSTGQQLTVEFCMCTLFSVPSVYLHGAVVEELLHVFGYTRSGHALGIGATDVAVCQPGGGRETGLKPGFQRTSEAGCEVI